MLSSRWKITIIHLIPSLEFLPDWEEWGQYFSFLCLGGKYSQEALLAIVGQHWLSLPNSWFLISHLTVAMTSSSSSWNHNKPMFSFLFQLLHVLISLFESAWVTGMEIRTPIKALPGIFRGKWEQRVELWRQGRLGKTPEGLGRLDILQFSHLPPFLIGLNFSWVGCWMNDSYLCLSVSHSTTHGMKGFLKHWCTWAFVHLSN